MRISPTNFESHWHLLKNVLRFFDHIEHVGVFQDILQFLCMQMTTSLMQSAKVDFCEIGSCMGFSLQKWISIVASNKHKDAEFLMVNLASKLSNLFWSLSIFASGRIIDTWASIICMVTFAEYFWLRSWSSQYRSMWLIRSGTFLL